MYVLKKVSIGGADVKIVVTVHSSTKPNDFLDLATGGDETEKMKFAAVMEREGVTINEYVAHLLKKIAKDTIDILESNRRFITDSFMEYLVVVSTHSTYKNATSFGGLRGIGEYDLVLSSPSTAIVNLIPNPQFFELYMAGKDVIKNVLTHEFQHHADMAYNELVHELIDYGRLMRQNEQLGYHSWIARGAIFELKREGLARFSEYANNGSFAFYFSSFNDFLRVLEALPRLDRSQVNQAYGILKEQSYYAGAAMVLTMLAARMKKTKIVVAIAPVANQNDWVRSDKLKQFYGHTDIYFVPPDENRNKVIRESKQLLADLRGKSHIKFLSEYESACRELDVMPLITNALYGKVKLACKKRFWSELRKRGIPPQLAG